MDIGQVHGHGRGGTDGVEADFMCQETKDAMTNGGDLITNLGEDKVGSNKSNSPVGTLVGADWSGIGSAGKRVDGMGDGGPGNDGAQDGVAGAMHGDDGILFVILLEFKGDGDTVSKMKVGVIMMEEDSGTKEMEVVEM
jgi:hypothetical protein